MLIYIERMLWQAFRPALIYSGRCPIGLFGTCEQYSPDFETDRAMLLKHLSKLPQTISVAASPAVRLNSCNH